MGERAFLVFGGTNDRAVVALARAFHACEARFLVVARSARDRIFATRYRDQVVLTRRDDSLSLALLEEIVAAARRAVGDARLIIVPNSEYLNHFLLGLEPDDLHRLGCVLPLVERSLYKSLSDKWSSQELFSAVVRTPRRLDGRVASAPAVAKPRCNIGDDGIARYPRLLLTPRALAEFRASPDASQYFLQEYVDGQSYYLLAYFPRSGTPLVASQRNLAQQPGGKSIVLAESATFHDDPVADRSLALLSSAGYHGFAMIEYIVDAEGACFIELNPRPWGPLQLCLDLRCGIVEAFIGDWMHDDSRRFDSQWQRRPAKARYGWLGGVFETRRRNGTLKWSPGASRMSGLLAMLGSDVYLRRDSWRVFARELT